MRILLFLLVFVISAVPANALIARPDVTGYWLTQNQRSVIKVTPCDKGICGIIHWITEGGMQYDSKNPYASRRNTPMCGLTILWGFENKGEGVWKGGRIYKADDGDMYHANVKLKDPNTLEVRGYVGLPMFGKTQTWTRVNEADYTRCTPPPSPEAAE